jgi:PAS domain S-box-containing protein
MSPLEHPVPAGNTANRTSVGIGAAFDGTQPAQFRMKVWRAALAPAAVLAAALVALLVLTFVLFDLAYEIDHADRLITDARRLQKAQADVESALLGFQVTDDPRYHAAYNATKKAFNEKIVALRAKLAGDRSDERLIRNLENALAGWTAATGELISPTQEEVEPDNATDLLALQRLREFNRALTRLTEAKAAARENYLAQLWTIRKSIFVGLAVCLLGIFPACAWWLRRLVMRIGQSYDRSVAAEHSRAAELAVTLRSIGDAVIASNAAGDVEFLNPAAEMLTGWTSADARGRPLTEVFDIVNEYTGEPAENPVARALRERRVVGLANHTVLRTRDGRAVPIEDSAAPILDADGEISGVILVFHDVTEKRERQRALASSERRFRNIFNQQLQFMVLLSPAGDLLEVNDLVVQVSGTTRDKLIGTKLWDAPWWKNLPDVQATWQQRVADAATSDGPIISEDLYETPAGEIRSGTSLITSLRTEENEIEGFIVQATDNTEARRAERELNESEKRYRALVELSPQTVWTADAERSVAYVNEHWQRFTGMTNADSLGTGWLQAVHPQFRSVIEQTWAQAAETGNGWNLEAPIFSAKISTYRWHFIQAVPLRGPGGKLDRWMGVAVDIHDRRMAEEAIRERERRLRFLNTLGEATRLLEDPGTIMTTVTALLGRHLHVSRCAYAEVASDGEHFTILHDYIDGVPSTTGSYELSAFGPRAVAKMHGQRTLVIDDVDRELSEAEGAATFNAIQIKAIICCPLVKEGELRAMMAVHQSTPRHWHPSEVSLVEEVVERCWDVIERARAESDARKVSERSRFLAESMPQKIFTAKPDGAVDYFNEQWITYTGLPMADILGWGWDKFIHPDDLELTVRSWREAVATGTPYECEHRFRNAAGEFRWHVTRALPMRDSEGAIAMWIGSNTDVDELKRIQAQLEAASHAKDSFLASLSHELRTPLMPVLMTAADLREDPRLPDDARKSLAVVQRNIELEARLIDDLLDVTRIARGVLPVRPQRCDAHSLIHLALEIVRDELQTKHHTLRLDLGAKRVGVVADPARLQQLFWNLFRNAVKFTPPHGTIIIRTRDSDDGLLIEVSDTGIGIESDALDRIFLPFEQAGLANDHRFGGLGLGLAIARAIVDLHGGTILVSSGGPGQGATFRIHLPNTTELKPEEEGTSHRANGESNGAGPSQGPQYRILLVEDHEPTLFVLHRLLARSGHQVVTAMSVADARTAAATREFDIVVSDLGLPDGTGFDLMRHLSSTYGLRGIALSGYGMDEDLRQSKEAGFITHLVKPIEFAQLDRVIKQLANQVPSAT